MATIQELELEINKIKERNQNLENSVSSIFARNKRVETEKSWETSLTRKIIISVLTYLVISSFFLFAGIDKPFFNSIVPAIAFILSTLSVPVVKQWWLKNMHKG